MNNEIDKIKEEIKVFNPKTLYDLKKFKNKFLSKKKGIIKFLFCKLKKIDINKKKILGKEINYLKKEVKKKILENNNLLIENKLENKQNLNFDFTEPGEKLENGSLHPISIIIDRIIDILENIGFNTYENSNEIEDDWHNFTALNIPINHPSREMHDTFFLRKNPDILLRTHTSSMQIRYMKNNKPPFKILSIGKVYRNETISHNSNYIFHQAEGFYINKQVSFLDLKEVIFFIINSLLKRNIKIRFRSSYFPFTEPSAEVDIYHNNKWIEIMGCGMIDPIVLKNVGINENKYSGYAFGLGIERLASIIYNIKDIRIYLDNDIRFLEQFKSEF